MNFNLDPDIRDQFGLNWILRKETASIKANKYHRRPIGSSRRTDIVLGSTEPALPYVEIVFIGLQIPADPFLSFTIIFPEKEGL